MPRVRRDLHIDREGGRPGLVLAALLAACVALVCAFTATAEAEAAPESTRLVYAPGKIVPIPASIPHEEGDMVDKRILPDLRWLAQRYPIYVTDGFSGKLPNGEHAGCRGCHVKGSDHHNGLAVDIVPLEATTACDGKWAPITRLARWAEPRQNRPAAPFRWVGYDGDAHHGCGHHLHLSWNHAPARHSETAEWVEVFPVQFTGVHPGTRGKHTAATESPRGPSGGISQDTTGGVAPRGN